MANDWHFLVHALELVTCTCFATDKVVVAFVGTCLGTCYFSPMGPISTDNVVVAFLGTCIGICYFRPMGPISTDNVAFLEIVA